MRARRLHVDEDDTYFQQGAGTLTTISLSGNLRFSGALSNVLTVGARAASRMIHLFGKWPKLPR